MTEEQSAGHPADLNELADSVVLANATGNEVLFLSAVRLLLAGVRAVAKRPIDMILNCPRCGMQHIDKPEVEWADDASGFTRSPSWTNPPHRSHLCHGCGFIWRPADVPTNGVEAIKTKGKADMELSDAENTAQPTRAPGAGRTTTPTASPCTVCAGTDVLCYHCEGMGIEPRRLTGYGECKCVLAQYCDGRCNPIYADAETSAPVPAAQPAPATGECLACGTEPAHCTRDECAPAAGEERRAREDGDGRWEVGFRNIVTILGGVRESFEIREVVEAVRALTGAEQEGPTPAWWKRPAPATGEHAAAVRTLNRIGYTYHGGVLWKPPIGSPPNFDAPATGDVHCEHGMLLCGLCGHPSRDPAHVDNAPIGFTLHEKSAWSVGFEDGHRAAQPTTGDEREYMTAYEQECQAMAAEGVKYWKDKYEALLQASAAHRREDQRDAARWRELLFHVMGTFSGRAFAMPSVTPIPGANIMRGSVAQHFSDAIDRAAMQRAAAPANGENPPQCEQDESGMPMLATAKAGSQT